MKKCSRIISIVLSVISLFILGVVAYGEEKLPDVAYSYGNDVTFMKIFSADLNSNENEDSVKSFSDESDSLDIPSTIKLFRTIPVKKINIKKSQRRYVEIGGELIGIRVKTDGVLIVGTEEFDTVEGKSCPAKKAGIKTGDTLKNIDGRNVKTNEELSSVIENSGGRKLELEIIRDGKKMSIFLTPEKSYLTNKYKGGIWIRDATGGIGTLTYSDNMTGIIASLGHGIYDVDTECLIPAGEGQILSARLTGVEKGSDGKAGELKGIIGNEVKGSLLLNCENGIYGKIKNYADYNNQYPVADISEIKPGKARIVTTAEGDEKKFYDIEIKKIYNNSENKNMIISVTDTTLLDLTGGIVQGMSGSPIIQNGMFIGAVTHVFLNDPTKGYAIFAENMLNTAKSVEALDNAS